MKYRNIVIAAIVSSILSSFSIMTYAIEPQATSNNNSPIVQGTVAPPPLPSVQSCAWTSPSEWFIYLTILVLFISGILAVRVIRSALSDKWSLADALSEEAEVTACKTNDDKTKTPLLDGSGQPFKVIEMHSSSSRIIALMGTVAVLLMYIGFGIFTLFSFGKSGTTPPALENVASFLLSGLALFAPYLINKFSSVFGNFVPK